jgi:hypothetical protein
MGQLRRVCRPLLYKGHTSQPTNRHMRDVVAPGNRGERLALRDPRQCFRLLMLGELRLPAEPNPARFGADPAFVGSAQDRWRSNSARPPSTVSIRRPCGVVVSAQGSPSDLKLAPAYAIASRLFSRSRVERARRSSFMTDQETR